MVITEVSCLVSLPITDMRNPVQTGDTTIGTLSKKTRKSVRLNRFTTWNRNWINISKDKFKNMEAKDKIEVSEKTKELGLPATWEEVYEMTEFTDVDSPVAELSSRISNNHYTDVIFVRLSGEDAETNLAFLKLRTLRDMYRKDWKPDWSNHASKYVIEVDGDDSIKIHVNMYSRRFLSFPNAMTAYLFYENFKDMILQAKDLI